MPCYWINFTNERGETWDEGVPYVATDEEHAERQMILGGCGGEDAPIEELRERYRTYFDDREAASYTVTLADGWAPDETGFPREFAA